MQRFKNLIQLATRFLSRNWFRILFAAVLAYSILVSFKILTTIRTEGWDFCQPEVTQFRCAIKILVDSFTLDSLDNFSILLVAILYLLEAGDRKRQSHYEAWQILDNAFSANVETSYARLKALQDLNQDGISLKGVDVPGADLEGINLVNADLNGANFRGAILTGANLRNAKLSKADFSPRIQVDEGEEVIKRTKLVKADLAGADLTGADLTGADLTDSILNRVCFTDTIIDPNTTRLSTKWLLVWEISNQHYKQLQRRRSNFRQEDFSHAYFAGIDFSRTNLVETNFAGANLESVNLQKANLTSANLRGANLRGANLTDANLTGADLTGADLTDAIFQGADLTVAKVDQSAIQGAYLTDRKTFSSTRVVRGSVSQFQFSQHHENNKIWSKLRTSKVFQKLMGQPTQAETLKESRVLNRLYGREIKGIKGSRRYTGK